MRKNWQGFTLDTAPSKNLYDIMNITCRNAVVFSNQIGFMIEKTKNRDIYEEIKKDHLINCKAVIDLSAEHAKNKYENM
jgi:hypothetical protein